MDRQLTSSPAGLHNQSRRKGAAALISTGLVVLLAAGALTTSAGAASLSKGLTDPPAWSTSEAVQFVPAPPRAAHAASAQPAFAPGSSEVTGEPLEYHKEAEGQGVEHSPKVYVVLWGSNFANLTTGKETQAKLDTLFKGLENSPYQGILTQYFDTHSHVSPGVTVSFTSDTSVAAPSNVGTRSVRAEAEKYRALHESTENLENAQFMVVAAPGSTYESGFEPAGEGFCAYHNLDNSGYAYAFVPYEGDNPFPEKECLESDGAENPVHETSRFASAAYADTVTDPRMNAWKTKAGHEIDYGPISVPCAKENDLELPSGAWAQNLFDDHLLKCKHSDKTPPFVYAVTQPATAINPTQGTLTAVVNPESLTTKYHFQWGLTKSYGNTTPVETLAASLENSSVTATIAGLGSETTYHYRIVAENSTGSTDGFDGTFTTVKAEPPYALTEPASNIEETTATLNGTINPKQLPTKYFMEWGESETYTHKTVENMATGSSNVPLHETLTGLQSLHEYHDRIRAESGGGLELGLDKTFVTPGWVVGPLGAAFGAHAKDLSCPTGSSRTCMAATGGWDETTYWNGTSWQPGESMELPAGYNSAEADSVSCWAANGCLAWGTLGECEPYGENGCTQHEYPAIWSWNGTKWTFQQKLSNTRLTDGGYELGQISCTSATFCQAGFFPFGAEAADSYVWNGSSWREVAMPVPQGGDARLWRVSCASPSLCEAGGESFANGGTEYLEKWNGQNWSLIKTVSAETQLFFGMSCVAEECMIAATRNGSGHESGSVVIRSVGGQFIEKEVPLPAGASERSVKVTGVSCPARETCVLVGGYVKASTGLEEVLVDQQSPQHEGGGWYPAHLPPFELANFYGHEYGARETKVSCWSVVGCMVLDGPGGAASSQGSEYGPELRLEDSPLPANTKLPAITPAAPEQGTAEAVSTGTWSHEATSYAYQWELCNGSGGECASITSATTASYTPTEANIGHTLRVKVKATNKVGSESAYTTVSPAVAPPPPPVNTQLPSVSPTSPEVGAAETTTTGTWTREITGYSYQWEQCNASGGECSKIAGATSSTYTPGEATLGHTLRASVTAKNSGGSTSASSAASGPVAGGGHFTQTIDSPNSIGAVSCIASTTDCVVADSTGKALYATNVTASAEAAWKAWAGPSGASPAQAVACPATSVCLLADGKEAAGGALYYATSLGGTFSQAYSPVYGVDAVSCVSTALCVTAQDGLGYFRYSTAPASTAWNLEEQGNAAMKAVSCLSSGICVIGDGAGSVHIATTTSQIESANWVATDVDGTTGLNGVACASKTSCIAVDGAANVVNLAVAGTGAATATTNHIDGTNSLTAVACSGSTCTAVDNVGNVFDSTNSGSSWSKAYALGDDLTSVSCASTTLCVATDTTGHVTAFRPV